MDPEVAGGATRWASVAAMRVLVVAGTVVAGSVLRDRLTGGRAACWASVAAVALVVVGASMTVVVVAGEVMEAGDEGSVPPVAAVVVVTFMTTGLAAAAWGAGVVVSVDSAGVPTARTCSALVFPVCTVSVLLVLN